MLTVAVDGGVHAALTFDLDAICRAGARRMLAAALEVERDAYLAAMAGEVDGDGCRLVVGNGRVRRG